MTAACSLIVARATGRPVAAVTALPGRPASRSLRAPCRPPSACGSAGICTGGRIAISSSMCGRAAGLTSVPHADRLQLIIGAAMRGGRSAGLRTVFLSGSSILVLPPSRAVITSSICGGLWIDSAAPSRRPCRRHCRRPPASAAARANAGAPSGRRPGALRFWWRCRRRGLWA